jgi:hypothetical protein
MPLPAEFNLAEAQKVMKEIVAPEVPKLYDESPILMNLINDGKTRTTFTNSRGVRLTADVEPLPTHAWRQEGSDFSIGGSDEKVNMSVTFVEYSIARQLTGSAIDCTSRETIVDTLSRFVEKDGMAANKEWNQQGYGNGSGSKGIVESRVSGTQLKFALPVRARQVFKGGQVSRCTRARPAYATPAASPAPPTPWATRCRQHLHKSPIRSTPRAPSPSTRFTTDAIAGDHRRLRRQRRLRLRPHDTRALRDHQRRDGHVPGRRPLGLRRPARLRIRRAAQRPLGGDDRRDARRDALQDGRRRVGRRLHHHQRADPGARLQKARLPDPAQMMGVPGSQNLDRGFKTISYNGLKWIVDTDCPPDKIFFLRRSTLMKFEVTKMKPLKLNGELLQPLPARPAARGKTSTSTTSAASQTGLRPPER